MQLSGYNVAPTPATCFVLDHVMRYLYHYPHIPLMNSRQKQTNSFLQTHSVRSNAKVIESPTNLDITVNTDANLARDLVTRRPVSSMIIELNGTTVRRCTTKQPISTNCTNTVGNLVIFKGENLPIFKDVKKTLEVRRFMEPNGDGINYNTPILENIAATIAQIKKDQLTPRIKQDDIITTWLHQQYALEKFYPF